MSVIGKAKFIKTVEKYRISGQTHRAKVLVVPSLPETINSGVTGVIVQSFDSIPWLVCIRLMDLIELVKKNKIETTNMRVLKEGIEIYTPDNKTLYIRIGYKSIKNPLLFTINNALDEYIMRKTEKVFNELYK